MAAGGKTQLARTCQSKHGGAKFEFCWKLTGLVKIFDLNPEKKISYILVNGLMANFEFWGHQSKNVDFLLT